MSISKFTITLCAKAVGFVIEVLANIVRVSHRLQSPDRRRQPDRRKSPIDQRLRTGLWLQFHRDTRSGEFDNLTLNDHTSRRVHHALVPEIVKYEFRDPQTGAPVASDVALETAMESVWKYKTFLPSTDKEQKAVFVMEAIGVELARRFTTVAIDKRQSARRGTHPAPLTALRQE